MGDLFNFRHIEPAARVLLICPDCGHENAEYADRLRSAGTYYCAGDNCDYIFDLLPGRRIDFGKSLLDACRKFYAAFYAVRGQGVR